MPIVHMQIELPCGQYENELDFSFRVSERSLNCGSLAIDDSVNARTRRNTQQSYGPLAASEQQIRSL